MERFDVVVVGARCAGSSLATLLARRGIRVCVVDLAEFPSDTPSTHIIQPSGALILESLGVLDGVLAAGAVPIDRFTIRVNDICMAADIDPNEYGAPGVCVRRITLDPLLVEAARAAGAQVRTGVRVSGVLRDDGRVAGVETDSGPIAASVVIGADGRRSTVASGVGARKYAVAPGGRMFLWGYFRGVRNREGHLRLGRIDELAFLSSPTDGDLFMAGIAPSAPEKHAVMADRERSLREGLRHWPELAEIVGDAELDGPIRAVTSWHGFFHEAAGPGWALIGDAGQFKDPTPGQGISDSLRQAVRLADAVVGGLRGGPAAMDAQLQRWWRWRDSDAREMHWLATDLGLPGAITPVREEVMADIAADQDLTLDFLRVLNHDIRPAKLFTARRMLRAAGRVARDQPHRRREVVGEVGSLIADNVRHARLDRPKHRPRRIRRAAAPPESPSERAAAPATRS